MDFATPEFRELLNTFNEHGVKYLIVGGFAVMVYSEPRYTKDLDVWVEASMENAAKVLPPCVISALHLRDLRIRTLQNPVFTRWGDRLDAST